MKRYRLAVCKGGNCRRGGGDQVYVAAHQALRRLELGARGEVSRAGCYGLCHLGPNVVVREDRGEKPDPLGAADYKLLRTPDEAYYWEMTPEKVVRVMAEHLGQDRIASDLLGDPTWKPGER